jgi:hypothetical protein
MYYPISQDGQVQEYNQLRKQYLAKEADRKHKQKLLRQEMGLPDIGGKQRIVPKIYCVVTYLCADNRGILSRLLGKKKAPLR